MLMLLCGRGEHGCNLFNEDNWIHQGKKVKKGKTVIHFLLKECCCSHLNCCHGFVHSK